MTYDPEESTTSPSTAQVTVEAVLSHVAEVKDILLRVHNLPDTAQVFFWYKGKNLDKRNEIARFLESKTTNKTRPAYRFREKIHHIGSLLFQIITQKDAEAYMLRMKMENLDLRKASKHVHVHPKNQFLLLPLAAFAVILTLLPKPSITSNNSNPLEGEDSVVFMCEPETHVLVLLSAGTGASRYQRTPPQVKRRNQSRNRILGMSSQSRTAAGPSMPALCPPAWAPILHFSSRVCYTRPGYAHVGTYFY
ncbi:cell adhesion molecule CEACAM8-like [Microtus pennsylvanicus]|uniref:cell adhesion molecule CEACAM8-like n=1 Tax=Microtus pennsylvanicus TaxID=10058 RepID=UPI003F6D1992